ncbi:MAG: leucyl aminopeptidase [Candidatus Uhrbacteria bacterium]|nr:leucyl aminopeptidase [Candidatus Uhrbacteria bacterium]
MLPITVLHTDVCDTACDLLVVYVQKDRWEHERVIERIDQAFDGRLLPFLRQERFDGAHGTRVTLPTFGCMKARKVCVIGLGEISSGKTDALRIAGGQLAKIAKEAKTKRIATVSPVHGALGPEYEALIQAFAEGVALGAYEFSDHFGTRTRGKERFVFSSVALIEPDAARCRAIEKALRRADVIVAATSYARDLINTSPRHMKPADLAAAAKAIVKRGSGITCKVYDRAAMERMGMGAALAVAEGSAHAPYFVHLTYTPKRKPLRRIALVGKGVTFDSGGLSLKPADAMTNMKIDMGGAAVVIGAFSALADLALPVEVHGVFAAVENMPSGTSYRPGDVVRAMNGMTIEVLNTDAEGRVTMADSLSYTVKRIKPDAILDFATLTGAVIVALGDDCTGYMSNDRSLARAVGKAAKTAGELFWELPLFSHYDEALRSKVADVNNTGGRSAGAIKAGLFLKHFVGNVPWVHCDIAGPVFCEKEYRADMPYGGTGVGVRTVLAYLEDLVNEKKIAKSSPKKRS